MRRLRFRYYRLKEERENKDNPYMIKNYRNEYMMDFISDVISRLEKEIGDDENGKTEIRNEQI